MRAKMISCCELLEEYSDFRDGLLDEERTGQVAEHLRRCPACASYDRVLGRGVGELRSLETIQPSDDFVERLQHRIYHLDLDRGAWADARTSRTPVALIALLAMAIGAAAWAPLLGGEPAVVELPPVAAASPRQTPRLPTLLNLPVVPPTALASVQPRDFLLRQFAPAATPPVFEVSTTSLRGR